MPNEGPTAKIFCPVSLRHCEDTTCQSGECVKTQGDRVLIQCAGCGQLTTESESFDFDCECDDDLAYRYFEDVLFDCDEYDDDD